jgi:hypothetical protein
MVFTCPHCSCRLEVDDSKASGRFVCPKCQQEIGPISGSPASEKSALSLGGSPATDLKRYGLGRPAPRFTTGSETENQTKTTDAEKLLQMLTTMVGKQSEGANVYLDRPAGKQRRALVCAPEEQRERAARLLAKDGYEVFVALDTEQAVERMRENKLDIVLLDPQFDAEEQGAAFVVREVNVLRPAQRRRLFFVLMSPSLRTLDAHGAFLNNVNAVINQKNIDDLTGILNLALRGYNEMYQDFNNALKLAAI